MTDKDNPSLPGPGEFLVYAGDNGQPRVQVRISDETVWLTQRQMADLYQVSVPTMSEHLRNIYEERELRSEATIRKFLTVQTEGNRSVSRLIDHYSLPVILAIGYRVRSAQGTRFRQWATTRLDEYLVKGSPARAIRKADVAVAKNYLSEKELGELNRIVGMYLDFAEDQAQRRKTMTMGEWVAKLDSFLQFNERNVLTHAGKISHELAVTHAEGEYEQFRVDQKRLEATQPTSDFDRAVEETKKLEAKIGKRPRQNR